MILVSFLNKYPLPEDFIKLLPEKCDACNHPMAVNETLTNIFCTNDDCPKNLISRISLFFTLLDVRVSFAEIKAMIKAHPKMTSSLDIFKLPKPIFKDCPQSIDEEIERAKEMPLWVLVSLTGWIDAGKAYEYFSECKTISEIKEQAKDKDKHTKRAVNELERMVN